MDEDNDDGQLPNWIDPDRKRGIITPSDRRYLAGKADYSDQAARNKRFRIRERVSNALYDFNDLRLLDSNDITRIFNQSGDEGPTLFNSLEFFYIGITEMQERFGETGIDLFEEILSTAIEEGERKRGHIAEVSVDIDVELTRPDRKEVLQKITEGSATLDEFRYYTIEEDSLDKIFNELAKEDKPLTAIDASGDERELIDAEQVHEFASEDSDRDNENE